LIPARRDARRWPWRAPGECPDQRRGPRTTEARDHQVAGLFVPGPERTPVAPHTRIEVIAGRTPAERRALLDAVHPGTPARDVMIVVHEPPLGNWGMQGRPASEVGIGYDLKV
jgi:phenylpyruvate tautomerase PptA (4-oxalocrotonate tautomerase family)